MESLGFVRTFLVKVVFYIDADLVVSFQSFWAKRRTVKALGVVAVNGSASITVRMSILTGPGGCRVRVRENGETLV